MNFYASITLLTMLFQPFLCRSSERQQLARKQDFTAHYTPSTPEQNFLYGLHQFIAQNLSKPLNLQEQAPTVKAFLQKPEKLVSKSFTPESKKEIIVAQVQPKTLPSKPNLTKPKVNSTSLVDKNPLYNDPSAIIAETIAIAERLQADFDSYLQQKVESGDDKQLKDALESTKQSLCNIQQELSKSYNQEIKSTPSNKD